MKTHSESELFDLVLEYPNATAAESYRLLIGLDDEKRRLAGEALLVLKPETLDEWSRRTYGRLVNAIQVFRQRVPLILFTGDVGTGKTALATSFADELARSQGVSPTLYALSLSSRGSGAVGEMTRLIAAAFEHVRSVGARSPTILLIDEADALAQSREFAQMHHEDRAGVDALIRGLDSLSTRRLAVLVLMCTNRVSALDPAVRRRAALTLAFDRPNEARRRDLLVVALDGLGFSPDDVSRLATTTGSAAGREYGFTYSDLTNRLIPALILDAIPDRKVTPERALAIALEMQPTPPFRERQE
jgi:AAA+ superfamily predicted ATPase